MALIAKLSSIKYQNILGALIWPSLLERAICGNQQNAKKSTSIDAIETFTNNLVCTKSLKWDLFRKRFLKEQIFYESQLVGIMSNLESGQPSTLRANLNISQLSQLQLDNILLGSLEFQNVKDFDSVIGQCICEKFIPSDDVLIQSLKFMSCRGKTNQINDIAIILKEQQKSNLMKKYLDLHQFKGFSMWQNCNVTDSLKYLRSAYIKSIADTEDQKLLQSIWKIMVQEGFASKGEAVLIHLKQFGEMIYSEHKDIFPLACIWKYSFCSKFYSDHIFSQNLIEKYVQLREIIAQRSITLTADFLHNHDLDAMYRLIEIYLKYNEKDACNNCLNILFDYQYYHKNLNALREISKTCGDLNMPLNQDKNEKLLDLLLNQPHNNVKTITSLRQQKFKYKF